MSFGSINNGEDAPMAEINVTPFVDVMLVLLIVFMITMPVLTHSIPLQLPTASAQSSNAPKEPLRLTINNEGLYRLGDRETSLPELSKVLIDAHEADAETVLAIAADKDVPYDHVAQALAAARDVGLSKVGFVTEAP